MNHLKICTLLSFLKQLKNTGPPMSSSACVLVKNFASPK